MFESSGLESFIFFSLLSLGVSVIGFCAFLAGIQSFLQLMARLQWLEGWSRLLRRLPTTLEGARRGDLVCLEGTCAQTQDAPLLVSPVFRTTCIAYWLEIRSGLTSRVTHQQSKALPFRLEVAEGEPKVHVNPIGSDTVELPWRGEFEMAETATLDGELARHLEASAIRLGSAEPLGITQGSLAPGERCTIIGRVEREGRPMAPYREPEGSVIGGRGALMVAAMGRRELSRQLLAQIFAVLIQGLAASVAIVGSLSIMVGATVLQPLMLIPLVIVGIPFAGWLVERQNVGSDDVAPVTGNAIENDSSYNA